MVLLRLAAMIHSTFFLKNATITPSDSRRWGTFIAPFFLCLLFFTSTCPHKDLAAQEAGDFAEDCLDDFDPFLSESGAPDTVGNSSSRTDPGDPPLKAPEDFVPHDPNAPPPCPQTSSPEKMEGPENLEPETGEAFQKASKDMSIGGHYSQALTASGSHGTSGKALQQKKEEAKRMKEIKKRIRKTKTYQAIQTVAPLPKSLTTSLHSVDSLTKKDSFSAPSGAKD